MFQFDFRLVVHNDGESPVIFPRLDATLDYYRFAASAAGLDHEEWASLSTYGSRMKSPRRVPAAPTKDFAILASGEELVLISTSSVIYIGDVKPGTVYGQFVFENWPAEFSEEYTAKLARAWQRFGTVHAAPFRSEPVEVRFPETPVPSGCTTPAEPPVPRDEA